MVELINKDIKELSKTYKNINDIIYIGFKIEFIQDFPCIRRCFYATYEEQDIIYIRHYQHADTGTVYTGGGHKRVCDYIYDKEQDAIIALKKLKEEEIQRIHDRYFAILGE